MTVSEIVKKMIDYSKGNLHDINHFMKVYAYAKVIGECENLDKEMPQESLENTIDPQQYKYEMDMKKNIVPRPKKLDGVISVAFIAIAIIVIILLFYYMV